MKIRIIAAFALVGVMALADFTSVYAQPGAPTQKSVTYKDKRHQGYYAPDGSPVYIDRRNNRKYYLRKGKKVYLQPNQIRTQRPPVKTPPRRK